MSVNPDWKGMFHRDKYARERIIKAARLSLPLLKKDAVVLDVGAFEQHLKWLLPSSVEYLPLDSYPFPGNIYIDLDGEYSLPKSDCIFLLETLEHLANPNLVLRSVKESLSPEGILVVSLPNESTLYHRCRGLFLGIMDGGCFGYPGKHLHLPSLKQSREFLRQFFLIVEERYYISPTAEGSSSRFLKSILPLIPDGVHQFLANVWPSFFSRGFIFLCKPSCVKRNIETNAKDTSSHPKTE